MHDDRSSPETDVCLVSAMVALVEHGIEPDVQELLVRGEPSRGIAPGALKKAIKAALGAHAQCAGEPVAWRWQVYGIWHYTGGYPVSGAEPLYARASNPRALHKA